MNRAKYKGDARYERVLITMDLLGITDVTTNRQDRNGTRVWRLPIKNNNSGKTFIEVASFKTGYVRNQNSGYSNYQLNKRCQNEPHYYPEQKYIDGEHRKTGKYLKYETRGCILIPIEIDRLEYLISYCLKNYFIKRANEAVDGKYVSQWYHDFRLEQVVKMFESTGTMVRIEDLEEKLDAMTEDRDCKNDRIHDLENKLSNAISPTKYECVKHKLHNLQTKLATINRILE